MVRFIDQKYLDDLETTFTAQGQSNIYRLM